MTSRLPQLHGRLMSLVVSCCAEASLWALAAAAPSRLLAVSPGCDSLKAGRCVHMPAAQSTRHYVSCTYIKPRWRQCGAKLKLWAMYSSVKGQSLYKAHNPVRLSTSLATHHSIYTADSSSCSDSQCTALSTTAVSLSPTQPHSVHAEHAAPLCEHHPCVHARAACRKADTSHAEVVCSCSSASGTLMPTSQPAE